ncbi:glycosyltransferase family 4 protein [Clostridium nigeriense]|uniref:glycosyltransferase family 4 protein n=1 Tax=Clostridium nigeriense TaxID=1805470 RepID=UPI003D348095
MSRKILYFTRTMGLGGTENVVLQLCELMNKNNKVIVCSCGGVNVEKLTKMGIKHYIIPDIENKNLRTIFKTLKILLKVINKEKIDIVHTHHRMAAFYISCLKVIKRFTFVNTVHNIFFDKKILTKFSYKKAILIAVGGHVKKNLCSFYGFSESKVTVIYNAVKPLVMPINPIEYIEEYRVKNNFLISNIGRLSEQKGMIYFIKAAQILLKKYDGLKFLIVGDGELKEELESYIKECNIGDNVILLGYRSDIQNIMAQVDLVVLSSLWEGFPLTPIEAFSVGKPVVATNIEGTVEIIRDKYNGLLVEPKNEIDLAKKIEFFIQNPNELKIYGNRAMETYRLNFDIEKFNNSYIEFYKRC